MSNRIAHGKKRKRHFLKEWRLHRGLTQEQLADRLETTGASISRLENGAQPYSQSILEEWAQALNCEPADLIMRNPLDPEAPWTIWDTLKPAQRRQAIRLLKALAEEEAA